MWTHFWDMHSGGRQKLLWNHIFIEASEREAKKVFYNKFKRNPERVTCTCCGSDYSISEELSLKQITGFFRGCRNLETPRNEKGLYKNNDPIIREHLYLEEGEEPPKGYKIDTRDTRFSKYRKYITIDEYKKQKDVLIICKEEIKNKERVGKIPKEGYVWID